MRPKNISVEGKTITTANAVGRRYLADAGDGGGGVGSGGRWRRRDGVGEGRDAEVDEGEVDALAGQGADPPRRVDVAAAGQLAHVVGQVAGGRRRVGLAETGRVHDRHRRPLTALLDVRRDHCETANKNNAPVYRLIGRYRRSKHKKSRTVASARTAKQYTHQKANKLS